MTEFFISLVVPKQSVKTVKTALEVHGKFNKWQKISPHAVLHPEVTEEPMLVPTTISCSVSELSDGRLKEEHKAKILAELDLENLSESIAIYEAPRLISNRTASAHGSNPFIKAVRAHLLLLPFEIVSAIDTTVDDLIENLPTTYSIYPPLLLLPAHIFNAPKWRELLYKLTDYQRQDLYQKIAASLDVTHIAINASIPFLLDNKKTKAENILRSPTNLTPLHGDFGSLCTASSPTSEDLNSAFWVSTKQNGITQFWAPRYTMFSRGNVSEKTRLLQLPTVTKSVEQAHGASAVDLYAGIGYFAFSYAKAGFSKIMCFELNPWSIEGFRRGVEANGWGLEIFREEDVQNFKPTLTQLRNPNITFLLFHMSNEVAESVLRRISGAIPPVTHVNCGLLPSSRASWGIAVKVLGREVGGWIHIHENLGMNDIETKSEEIAEEIQKLLDGLSRGESDERGRSCIAFLEHVEKVKTFAPGVMHCVLDVRVMPLILKG